MRSPRGETDKSLTEEKENHRGHSGAVPSFGDRDCVSLWNLRYYGGGVFETRDVHLIGKGKRAWRGIRQRGYALAGPKNHLLKYISSLRSIPASRGWVWVFYSPKAFGKKTGKGSHNCSQKGVLPRGKSCLRVKRLCRGVRLAQIFPGPLDGFKWGRLFQNQNRTGIISRRGAGGAVLVGPPYH